MGWQWHRLDHMQIIDTSLQIDDYTSIPHHSVFYRLDALPAAQQSTDGNLTILSHIEINRDSTGPGKGPCKQNICYIHVHSNDVLL